MNMINIVKNNLHRALALSNYVILTMSITLALILGASFFTSQAQSLGSIAVIGDIDELDRYKNQFEIHRLEEPPAMSEMVRNKYDAVLTKEQNGQYEVFTLRSEEFKVNLEQSFSGTLASTDIKLEARGTATNILGFLLMYILIQGIMFMKFFSEDKENGTFKRIVTGPVGIKGYLVSQFITTFLLIYIPTFTVLIFSKEILKIDLGLSYFCYSWLLTLIVFIAAAAAICITAFVEKEDNAMTLAGAIIVLTSLLSGAFYTIDHNNWIIKTFNSILPQTFVLRIVQGVEQELLASSYFPEIAYLLLTTMLLFTVGLWVCRKRFNRGAY